MTKQEEITDIISTALQEVQGSQNWWEVLSQLVKDLDKLGVVIKVDRELPDNPYKTSPLHSLEVNEENATRGGGYGVGQVHMIEAGYVAVEPLIEE